MTTRPKRPSADKTRKKILCAAKQVFLQNGFDAAYIKDIAKIAAVNTNLIFHHFTNKETLWHMVKDSILENGFSTPNYDESSAKGFFKSVLDYRFDLYTSQPDLVKLLQWQHLTKSRYELTGEDPSSPFLWIPIIEKLQNNGEITKAIEPDQIMLFIIFSTHAPFWQDTVPLDEPQKKQYKDMVFNMCCQQFNEKNKK